MLLEKNLLLPPKQLYTSYFAKSGKHPMAYAITGETPKWLVGMQQIGKLAPTWSMVSMYKRGKLSREQFTQLYFRLLDQRGITPQFIADILPEGSILCCYEGPGQFCHRYLAADWLRNGANVIINELE